MTEKDDNLGRWEQRWHPLRREWVVYAAHRNFRPWGGSSVAAPDEAPAYDPDCYLCPGNSRVHGARNPHYEDVFVFDNDHPVVGQNAPAIPRDLSEPAKGLYRREKAEGISRVICYDPRHNVTLAQIPLERVAKVFSAWQDETRQLAGIEGIRYALIFENRGEIVGVSNPHPHCQLYATSFVFSLIEREIEAAAWHRSERGTNLFEEIIRAERSDAVRVIAENEAAIAFVPFFARYAYEVMVFPKSRHPTLTTLSEEEMFSLADVFQQVIRRYDLLFGFVFPYVMAIHQAPLDPGDYSDYHLHLLFQPPLRQPGLQKFLAGPEIGGGNFMADTMPEEKARELQQVDISTWKPL